MPYFQFVTSPSPEQTDQQLRGSAEHVGKGLEHVCKALCSPSGKAVGGRQSHVFLRAQSALVAVAQAQLDLWLCRSPQLDSQVRNRPLCSPAAANATTIRLRWLLSMYSSLSITFRIIRSFRVSIRLATPSVDAHHLCQHLGCWL